MKKILAISGVALGVLVLAGCGAKQAAVAPSTQPVASTTAKPTMPAPNAATTAESNPAASLPPVPTTTAPATTSDVESAVSSVNADLNAVDKNAPDQNGLNDASVGTGTAAAGATTGTSSN